MTPRPDPTRYPIPPGKYVHGTALVVSLVMLLAVLLLSMSMANRALTDEKAARNQQERLVALHAAESALLDAESDIENARTSGSRSAIFSSQSAIGFTDGCGKGDANPYQGLCLDHGNGPAATWRQVDLGNTGTHSASVRFGHFTGRSLPVGGTTLPGQSPRYIIELLPDNEPGQTAWPAYIYRITAIGFGTTTQTQAVVQSLYRKAGNGE